VVGFLSLRGESESKASINRFASAWPARSKSRYLPALAGSRDLVEEPLKRRP